ncbi:MAG: L-threonylcarbamoyladenylate synthase [Cyanobacteriota bacterium]
MNPAQSSVLSAQSLAAHLQDGGLALVPTDTLPALASLPVAAEQIWTLKARPASKPLILMGADPEVLLSALQLPLHPDWVAMAQQVWPGACTLVLPASAPWIRSLHPQGGTIGLRVPASALALELLRLTGPLATSSANRSGDEPCQSAEQAAEVFPETPRLGPVPWPPGSGVASTVLRWVGPSDWRVLRAGAIRPPLAGGSGQP